MEYYFCPGHQHNNVKCHIRRTMCLYDAFVGLLNSRAFSPQPIAIIIHGVYGFRFSAILCTSIFYILVNWIFSRIDYHDMVTLIYREYRRISAVATYAYLYDTCHLLQHENEAQPTSLWTTVFGTHTHAKCKPSMLRAYILICIVHGIHSHIDHG